MKTQLVNLWSRLRFLERICLGAAAGAVPLYLLTIVLSALTGWWLALLGLWTAYVAAVALWSLRLMRHRYNVYVARSSRERAGSTIIGFDGRTDGWGVLVDSPADSLRYLTRAATETPFPRLVSFALATRSPVALDLLALRATLNRFDFGGLVAVAALFDSEPARARLLIPTIDFSALVQTARVVADRGGDGADAHHLLTMALANMDGAAASDIVIVGRLLVSAGRRHELAPVIERLEHTSWDRQLLVSDMLNPFTEQGREAPDRREAWLVAANEPFRNAGLEPLRLRDEETPNAFDRLTTDSVAGTVNSGPLVTVVMSTYQPGEEVLVAVRSIIAQSYRNWELLIVDDASGAEYSTMLSTLEGLDERIRVVSATVNGGTYVRRNQAIREARGEFVTMQDSDDWSHPRRLELQVAHLQAHPELPANTVYALRVSQELLFVQPRGVQLRLSEPGLMLRRAEVIERIGYFDEVRKSGDSEFRQRLEAAFGISLTPIDTSAPLMLMRFDFASLSGSDYTDGWTHPARAAYRSAHRLWREREADARRTPHYDPRVDERPFPAPKHVGGSVSQPETCDALLILDASRSGKPARFLARVDEELRSAVASGVSIAVLHAPALQRAGGPPELHPIAQSWFTDGLAAEVFPHTPITASTVLVRHATSAIGLPAVFEPAVRTRRVIVVEDREFGRDRASENYARMTVASLVRDYTGIAPEWHIARAAGDVQITGFVEGADAE